MLIYLDESGDTGWAFNYPYRRGGSSRYLTIAMLMVPNGKQHIPKRIVKDLYRKTKTSPGEELKGCNLDLTSRSWFANATKNMLSSHQDIKILAITVYKQNVQEHIRKDTNKLYNYMIRLCLLDKLQAAGQVTFMPDPRTIKVASGNSLVDYLNTVLWMEMDSTTTITQVNHSSRDNLNIQFADILANIIWRNYELKDCSNPFVLLNRFTEQHRLFFP